MGVSWFDFLGRFKPANQAWGINASPAAPRSHWRVDEMHPASRPSGVFASLRRPNRPPADLSPLRESNRVRYPIPSRTEIKTGPKGPVFISGGEGGIRTPGTVSPYTRFPGEHLKPLSHLSEFCLIWGIDSILPMVGSHPFGAPSASKTLTRFVEPPVRYHRTLACP